MRIQHNITAMNSYRNFSNNNSKLSKNLEKLSSGYNINRAGDDAAGLAISEKMRAQITGLEGATKNSKDGISLIQTAEGALTEVHDMLNRMTTLAEQSANGTYQNELDREQLQKEIQSLKEEIDRIADSTNFNGLKLLDGSLSTGATGSSGSVANVAVSGLVAANQSVLKGNPAEYTTEKFGALTAAASGDTYTLSMNYTDRLGNEQTYTVTIHNANGTTGSYETSTGKKGKVSSLAAGATAVATAFKTAIASDTEFGKIFKVTIADTSALKFTATEAGSNGATIKGGEGATGAITFTATKKDGSSVIGKADLTQTDSAKVKAGVDRTTAYRFTASDALWKVSDNNDVTASVLATKAFTIGGKKFVFVNDDISNNAKAAALMQEAGIAGFVKTSGAAAISNNDVKSMITTIEGATGLDLVQGNAGTWGVKGSATGDTWTAASTGTSDVGFIIQGKLSGTTGSGGLSLQIGDTADSYNKLTVSVGDMHVKALKLDDVDISTQDGAAAALDKIKAAINQVSDTRGTLGALQNRLDHTINNLGVMRENIQNAESTIRDTDVAEEMMTYTKNNILNQSAQAMLAQANQLPQGVLQLLQ